jgi:asparagine synthase (glutamine-hydrolysing)
MCGFAGYIGKKALPRELIDATLHRMRNRGPDTQDSQTFTEPLGSVALLSARLAILDLDPRSSMPFSIGDYTIAYNGEIYNYVELQAELKKRGIQLTTTSDTEVLLHYYILFGEECVQYFEGMWAFAILDKKNQRLFLSRDRFGEKPLYLFRDGEALYFGSEVKLLASLAKRQFTINEQQLLRYLVHGYKSLYKSGEQYFREITELPAGHSLLIDMNGIHPPKRYWHPRITVNPAMSRSEAVEGFRHHFLESVKIRLRADVPLAFCLSGGVDSSAIISTAAKCFQCDVTSFSIIDRDPRYNEEALIRATIDDLQCKHHLITLDTKGFFERLQELVAYHDAPVATITYLVHSMLSERISQQGYKVAFSGTSADELVTGYYDHFLLHLAEMRNHPQYREYLAAWQTHIQAVTRNPFLRDPDLYVKNPDRREHIYLDRDLFRSCLKVPFDEPFREQQFTSSLLRNRMLNELFVEATPVILHEDDLNSMLYSVENRSPYLDTKLFEFCYSIPPEHLIVDGQAKYVLREAMAGILNDRVRCERTKRGFNASINTVVDFNDPATDEYLFGESPIFDILDRDKVRELLRPSPLSDSVNKFAFSFINAKIFVEQFS